MRSHTSLNTSSSSQGFVSLLVAVVVLVLLFMLAA